MYPRGPHPYTTCLVQFSIISFRSYHSNQVINNGQLLLYIIFNLILRSIGFITLMHAIRYTCLQIQYIVHLVQTETKTLKPDTCRCPATARSLICQNYRYSRNCTGIQVLDALMREHRIYRFEWSMHILEGDQIRSVVTCGDPLGRRSDAGMWPNDYNERGPARWGQAFPEKYVGWARHR